MLLTSAILLLLEHAFASPIDVEPLQKRQCPPIHVFGARETTVAQGYGSSITVVDLVLNSHSGATSEAIVYPACGGQSSCGGISYASSVQQGVAAVTTAVNNFNSECPSTQLVLVGYSQGGQIFDDALCGGGDPDESISNTAVTLTASAVNMVKAAIFMGDPRYIYGKSYDVGTCTAGGFAARPASFTCPSGNKIRSYCDASDPYCCNGNNAATHQGYGAEYGSAALTFINSLLSSSGTTTGGTTTTSSSGSTTTSGSGSGTVAKYGQCGGIGYTGSTTCASGSTCTYSNAYYSQCL